MKTKTKAIAEPGVRGSRVMAAHSGRERARRERPHHLVAEDLAPLRDHLVVVKPVTFEPLAAAVKRWGTRRASVANGGPRPEQSPPL